MICGIPQLDTTKDREIAHINIIKYLLNYFQRNELFRCVNINKKEEYGTMVEKFNYVMNKILNVCFVLLIFGSLSLCTTNIISGKPSILGYRVMWVVSGSMEPTIMTDQLILGKTTDGSDVSVGDIAIYERKENGISTFIVHRIIDTYEEGDEQYYIFKGDHNEIEDPYGVPQEDLMYKVILY